MSLLKRLGRRSVLPEVRIEYDAAYLNKAVFVVGSGKSGTTLLQALFDGHPNLVVFPVESTYYLRYPELEASSNQRNVRRRFLRFWIKKSKFSWMADGVYTKHRVEAGRDFTGVDYELFCVVLRSYDFAQHTRIRFYQALIEAYRQALGQRTSDLVGFVDKTPLHMFWVDHIRQDFPDAKFVHMLRDPYDNYLAYRTNALKLRSTFTAKEMLTKYLDGYIAPSFELAEQRLGDSYHTIRYEDLVMNPEEAIKALIEWLGIPHDEALHSVTLAGKDWLGNSSSGEKFAGISADRLGHGRLSLSDEEKRYIHRRLDGLAGEFGYVG